jgi:SAM-dependent methyltransferase
MIENVWLGDTATKQAILGNWLTVDLPAESFDAVYGDGSINMLPTDQDRITVIDRCRSWLKPGGKIVLRMFCRPEKPVTREWLQQEVKKPTVNWTAFRRLVPMALLGETGGNQVQWRECYKYFNELFPDRTQLPYTLEQIARMDAYQDVDTSTWFPTRTEIQQLWPATEFVDVGTYDIANLCPIMILKN